MSFPTGRAWALIAFACLVLMSCSSGESATSTTETPADLAPGEVVTQMLEAVIEGRFEDTADLTDTDQAALLILAEGADANDVVDALDEGGETVAANFWSGFAQTLDTSFHPDQVEVDTDGAVTQDGYEFVMVTVVPPDSEPREFFLRRNGTWRIDLMATFGPVLAERLVVPVEGLLSSANSNAARVLVELSETAPSLRVAANNPSIHPSSHQSLLALIERVTRAG